MRNYTIPKYPEYDENIKMLENTDPADADSVFNPLFSTMINNTAAIRSKFNGVTMKDMEIVNIPNTRDYDYLSLELGGNTRVIPENPELEISPDNVASIESVGENGNINVLSTSGNLLGKGLKGYVESQSPCPDYYQILGDAYVRCIKTTSSPQNVFTYLGNSNPLKSKHTYTVLVDLKSNALEGQTWALLGIKEEIYPFSNSLGFDRNSKLGRYKHVTVFNPDNVDTHCGFVLSMIRGNPVGTYADIRIMLFEGDVDINTPYQEGIVNTYSIPLKDTDGNTLDSLKSIPASDRGFAVSSDRIIKRDKIWQIERSTAIDKFTGGEKWTLIDNKETGSLFRFHEAPTNALTTNYYIHCTHIPYGDYYKITVGDDIGAYVHYGDRFIRVPNSIATTEEQFKSWLQTQAQNGTPLKMVYGLGTKIYTPLHQDTQTILNSLEKTYNGSTIIMGTDEVAPLITSTYARGSMSTKQINGCEVNDEIIGDRNLLTAGKTVELINSMLTARLEAIQ